MKTKYLLLLFYIFGSLCYSSSNVDVLAKVPTSCEFLGIVESHDFVGDGEVSEESTLQELKTKAVGLGGNVLEYVENPEIQELHLTHGHDGGKTYAVTKGKAYKCPDTP